MRQTLFEARHGADWRRFEAWLDRHEKLRRREQAQAEEDALPDADVPRAYRQVCQHLALARDRAYSPNVVDRLNRLAWRGHHLLYAAHGDTVARALEFIAADFPRLVRAQRVPVTAAACLFFGPFFVLLVALQLYPDFVYYLIPPEAVARFQEMHDPHNTRLGMRDADDNIAMFGFYIWNNVKIGFQTFAGGIAFGLGSIFYLVANGALIGALAGYITQSGYGTPFWSFVSGHSAMELVAIVISGAAGLRLGGALVAPGARSRKAALLAAARPATRLMVGAAGMFFIAAFIEAFWSPLSAFPPLAKWLVGALLWIAVAGYFVLGGRGRAA